jgi:high affinity Mn2+ porin
MYKTRVDWDTVGESINGALYRRKNDTFGLAIALHAISGPAQQYFGAGGSGMLVGDGGLSYVGARILETYYKIGLTKEAGITADYKRVGNPSFNSARGPVSVFGLRYHIQR